MTNPRRKREVVSLGNHRPRPLSQSVVAQAPSGPRTAIPKTHNESIGVHSDHGVVDSTRDTSDPFATYHPRQNDYRCKSLINSKT